MNVQFSSVTQSCPTICDPVDRCMPGFPVHHQLPELTQTHVHRVGDDICSQLVAAEASGVIGGAHRFAASQVALVVKNPPVRQET